MQRVVGDHHSDSIKNITICTNLSFVQFGQIKTKFAVFIVSMLDKSHAVLSISQ